MGNLFKHTKNTACDGIGKASSWGSYLSVQYETVLLSA